MKMNTVHFSFFYIMNHKSPIRIFLDEIYPKYPEKNSITNKTDVYFIDDNWSLDLMVLKIIEVTDMF